MKILTQILIISFLIASCSKEEKQKLYGTSTLSSERVLKDQTYAYYGFSFDKGSAGLYNPASSSDTPDFALVDNDGFGGNMIISFNSDNFKNSFALLASFTRADSALYFFNNYLQVGVDSYTGQAIPVLKNQIWLFKTRNDKYGKILIMDTLQYMNKSDLVAEVKFKWVYQPDGSDIFTE